MNWIKRHKLWSLVFLYFGVGFLVSLLGIADPLVLGELMGLFFLAYLFLCFIVLKIIGKRKIKDEEI